MTASIAIASFVEMLFLMCVAEIHWCMIFMLSTTSFGVLCSFH